MASLGVIYAYGVIHFCLRNGDVITGGWEDLHRGLTGTTNLVINKEWLIRDIATPSLIKWGE